MLSDMRNALSPSPRVEYMAPAAHSGQLSCVIVQSPGLISMGLSFPSVSQPNVSIVKGVLTCSFDLGNTNCVGKILDAGKLLKSNLFTEVGGGQWSSKHHVLVRIRSFKQIMNMLKEWQALFQSPEFAGLL